MKKSKTTTKPAIRIAIECDPLQFLGFSALLEPETDIELIPLPSQQIESDANIDLALLSISSSKNAFNDVMNLKRVHPGLRIIAVGSGASDETMLEALASGAMGYVDEAALPREFVQAIRVVHEGSVWAPRRILSAFVESARTLSERTFFANVEPFTMREKEVLERLVVGQSNKEIAAPLGIEERTVKAHVAKLLRKVGVKNRVALSVYALSHSLVQS